VIIVGAMTPLHRQGALTATVTVGLQGGPKIK